MPTEGATTPLATSLVARQKPQPKYRRIGAEEASLILRLRFQEGLSLEAIAGATRRSLSTISEFLARYPDTTQQAIALLKTKAEEAAQVWAAAMQSAALQGNHRPARDLLAATGAIRDVPAVQVGVKVNCPGSKIELPEELRDLLGPEDAEHAGY